MRNEQEVHAQEWKSWLEIDSDPILWVHPRERASRAKLNTISYKMLKIVINALKEGG